MVEQSADNAEMMVRFHTRGPSLVKPANTFSGDIEKFKSVDLFFDRFRMPPAKFKKFHFY